MLWTREMIEQSPLDEWKKDAVTKFNEKISDKARPFPCIPATQGFQLNRFRYGFVSELNAGSQLAVLLEEYSKTSRDIGMYTSLIIFYEWTEKGSIEEFEGLFWDQLNKASELDSISWPSHIPDDPNEPLWEFCFHGEQYFMYCATPSHTNRQSRSFPYFMLAITPRWVLERFYSINSNTEKIKAIIRERLENYDSAPIHPDLKTYGSEDNFEWKQYFLRDDETALGKCPFHKSQK